MSTATRATFSRSDATHLIPKELRSLSQWVVWKHATDENGRPTKHPYQANIRGELRLAATNRSGEWSTFEQAKTALRLYGNHQDPSLKIDGIGFVLNRDGLVGIDFDNALVDGEIQPWAQKWLDALGPSYTEVSPSGNGFKAIYKGVLPPKGKADGRSRGGYGDGTGKIEVFHYRRFFTITADVLFEEHIAIVAPNEGSLLALVEEVDAREKKERKQAKPEGEIKVDNVNLDSGAEPKNPFAGLIATGNVGPDSLSDHELIEKARNASNGGDFRALFDAGDTSRHNHDESSADLALMNMLAFWTNRNPSRMESLFSRSALGQREKWKQRPDYRARTIEVALEGTSSGYGDSTRSTTTTSGAVEPTLDATLARRPLTDLGNAERLVRRHGQDLRYCHPWGRWLVWDGRRWKSDDTGAVMRLAKKTVRQMLREAATLEDDDKRKALTTWALGSEKRDRLSAMIDLARSELGIPILPPEMDRDGWLFNCRNGTIDLRTGTIRPHNRADAITKLCDVEYDPAATCPTWDSTLETFFERGDSIKTLELVDYWQRLAGCCIAGVIRDHVLPIAYGSGSNGKSTVLNALIDTFGHDYAMKAPPDFLMAKKGESHPTDMADLFGKRLVVAIETPQGRRLNETLVKEATGGDKIRARRMREDFWEFSPTHTLILATNHKPGIRGTDLGIWRRLRLVPFTVTMPDNRADKTVPERLRAEVAGILRWCVEGCREWQERGLNSPPEVHEATKSYREEQDIVGAFISDCCIQGPQLRAKATTLYEAYSKWVESSGERMRMSQREFGQALDERGFEKKRSDGFWYLGIGVLETSPQNGGGY